MEIPETLRYTEEHEWLEDRGNGIVRIGITDYAQDQLGDVVYVELGEVQREVERGDVVAEVESTKSVGEVYAPFPGRIASINGSVRDRPELVNQDPYGEGWLFEMEAVFEAGDYLDHDAYRSLIE